MESLSIAKDCVSLVHEGTWCDECGMKPIIGIYSHCKTCNQNFCNKCCQTIIHNPKHIREFVGEKLLAQVETKPLEETKPVENPTQIVHEGVSCDMCSIFPIIGVRCKCLHCPNLDLCSNCYSKGSDKITLFNHRLRHNISNPFSNHDVETHNFIFIEKPIVGMSAIVQFGMSCDECKRSPIIGNRYCSEKNPDYNICSNCYTDKCKKGELKGNLEDGIYIMSKPPITSSRSCDGCNMYPIVGPHYYCLQHPNFDLCHVCYLDRVNKASKHAKCCLLYNNPNRELFATLQEKYQKYENLKSSQLRKYRQLKSMV